MININNKYTISELLSEDMWELTTKDYLYLIFKKGDFEIKINIENAFEIKWELSYKNNITDYGFRNDFNIKTLHKLMREHIIYEMLIIE